MRLGDRQKAPEKPDSSKLTEKPGEAAVAGHERREGFSETQTDIPIPKTARLRSRAATVNIPERSEPCGDAL